MRYEWDSGRRKMFFWCFETFGFELRLLLQELTSNRRCSRSSESKPDLLRQCVDSQWTKNPFPWMIAAHWIIRDHSHSPKSNQSCFHSPSAIAIFNLHQIKWMVMHEHKPKAAATGDAEISSLCSRSSIQRRLAKSSRSLQHLAIFGVCMKLKLPIIVRSETCFTLNVICSSAASTCFEFENRFLCFAILYAIHSNRSMIISISYRVRGLQWNRIRKQNMERILLISRPRLYRETKLKYSIHAKCCQLGISGGSSNTHTLSESFGFQLEDNPSRQILHIEK